MSTQIWMTLIDEQTQIEGTLQVSGEAHLYGKVKGRVIGTKDSLVVVQESGLIEGEVEANDLVVSGTILGNIHAKNRVVVEATGKVIGDISTPRLIVRPGALLQGKSSTAGRSNTDSTTM
jgi:cytoskeletal protein CcmA (bactofilin family)